MNKEALLALAAKWQRDAQQPETQPGSITAASDGFRTGLNKCATDLATLIKLLGD